MPRQCHPVSGDCWCVNDLGEEVDGTRCSHGKEIMCPYNRTQAVKGHIQLNHNITDNLEKHTENLKPILITQLSQWMMIEEDYIQEIEISADGEKITVLKVDFVISGEVEDDLDLASSVHHLRLKVTSSQTIIHYESFTLVPIPTTLETHHKFHAEPVATGSIRNYYQVHKTTIVVLIGLILLASILVVILVQVVKKRRVATLQHRDNYQQNLAFTNEVYGKLAFLDDIQKEKTPEEKDLEKNEASA
jgi:hypothetical protein